jgi:hypothetical protein
MFHSRSIGAGLLTLQSISAAFLSGISLNLFDGLSRQVEFVSGREEKKLISPAVNRGRWWRVPLPIEFTARLISRCRLTAVNQLLSAMHAL